MAAELLVGYGALSQAAEGQHQCSEQTAEIEQARQAADIPHGSLGKILPAEEILAEFDSATQAAAENLADLRESFEGVAGRLEAIESMFRDLDEHVAERFAALMGG